MAEDSRNAHIGYLEDEVKKIDERARELLGLVKLGARMDHLPDELSGGERQRVAIARALAVEPKIILMDEPFAALDLNTRRRLRTEVVAIWRQTGKTIVFVTHDIEEAVYLADRVLVMGTRPGRIIEDFKIELPRPRIAEVVASEEFTSYRKQMLHLLRH